MHIHQGFIQDFKLGGGGHDELLGGSGGSPLPPNIFDLYIL